MSKMIYRYKYNEFTKIPEMPNALLLYLDVLVISLFSCLESYILCKETIRYKSSCSKWFHVRNWYCNWYWLRSFGTCHIKRTTRYRKEKSINGIVIIQLFHYKQTNQFLIVFVVTITKAFL